MAPPGPNSSGYVSPAPVWVDALRGAAHTLTAVAERTTALERRLWVAALVLLCADFSTTAYGLQLGLREFNPLARSLLARYGFVTFVVLKGFALVVAAVGWTVLPREYRFIIPGCVAGPWAVGSLVNAVVILRVVGW